MDILRNDLKGTYLEQYLDDFLLNYVFEIVRVDSIKNDYINTMFSIKRYCEKPFIKVSKYFGCIYRMSLDDAANERFFRLSNN
jgi:hypothetical protein